MKTLSRFIANTISGGLLFMLPVTLLIMLLGKANTYVSILSEPLAELINSYSHVGLESRKLLAVFLMILICFLSGLAFKTETVKKWISGLEKNVFCFIPGYAMMKAIVAGIAGGTEEHNMTSVLVQDGESWLIGFLVEESNDYCTVFFPEAPRHDSGEVRVVPKKTVKKIPIPTNKVAQSLKNFGKGVIGWIEK
jgi:uncharacterized membrane protein